MTEHPIPNAALDDRLAFLGLPGSGKTYGAGTCVERLLKTDARAVIIDPLGAWWGLALSPAGEKPSGFRKSGKLIIVGGEHGDLPLTESSGSYIHDSLAPLYSGIENDRFAAEGPAWQFHLGSPGERAPRCLKDSQNPQKSFCFCQFGAFLHLLLASRQSPRWFTVNGYRQALLSLYFWFSRDCWLSFFLVRR